MIVAATAVKNLHFCLRSGRCVINAVMLLSACFPQGVFAVTIGVFAFFNVQKTMLLQLFTAVMRWLGNFLIYTIFFCIIVTVSRLRVHVYRILYVSYMYQIYQLFAL